MIVGTLDTNVIRRILLRLLAILGVHSRQAPQPWDRVNLRFRLQKRVLLHISLQPLAALNMRDVS
jgi:hypothetical protein